MLLYISAESLISSAPPVGAYYVTYYSRPKYDQILSNKCLSVYKLGPGDSILS